MHPFASPKLFTRKVGASLSINATTGCTEGGSGCTASGFGQGGYGALAHSHFPGFPGGRLAALRPINVHTSRRKYPRIQNDYRDGRDSIGPLEGSTSSFLGREATPSSLSSPDSDNNSHSEKDICGGHCLVDKRWRNDSRMYTKCDFRNVGLLQANSSIPPLPRDYQTHRSNHFHHYAHRKELSPGHTSSQAFGSYDGCNMTSLPAILLPAAVVLNGRHPLFVEGYKNRLRTINQPCSLFTRELHGRCTEVYPDPVNGAPSAAFNQRLSEMSSLEGETVRQEKIKNMVKTKRQFF